MYKTIWSTFEPSTIYLLNYHFSNPASSTLEYTHSTFDTFAVPVIFVRLTGGAGHVGPVLLLHGAEQLEVVEAELGDGAHAAARPAAAQRVRGAGGHLARAQ